jgi:hypothetical protein
VVEVNELARFVCLPWWWMQRRMDVRMLWPICRDLSPDLDTAHEAFMAHAALTPCWIEYYGERALIEAVRRLK